MCGGVDCTEPAKEMMCAKPSGAFLRFGVFDKVWLWGAIEGMQAKFREQHQQLLIDVVAASLLCLSLLLSRSLVSLFALFVVCFAVVLVVRCFSHACSHSFFLDILRSHSASAICIACMHVGNRVLEGEQSTTVSAHPLSSSASAARLHALPPCPSQSKRRRCAYAEEAKSPPHLQSVRIVPRARFERPRRTNGRPSTNGHAGRVRAGRARARAQGCENKERCGRGASSKVRYWRSLATAPPSERS